MALCTKSLMGEDKSGTLKKYENEVAERMSFK